MYAPQTLQVCDEVDSPHELLGVRAGERDPVMIVGAAARRLRVLSTGSGREVDVRRSLASLIRRARDRMLQSALDG
jgi:hypothetical protein